MTSYIGRLLRLSVFRICVRFQASSANSARANWLGDEDGRLFLSISTLCCEIQPRLRGLTSSGIFSNDYGDGNENGKKNVQISKTTIFHYSVHFFPVAARLRCESFLISRFFVRNVNARKRINFLFSAWT